MKTLRRALLVVVAASALVIGTVAAAPFASATTGTLEITTNTTLTEDHYGEIAIAADNVTLDCAGHQVIGPPSGPGSPGVLLNGRTGVTVKNCHVTGGFQFGFALYQASGNTLSGNVATGYGDNGFSLEDGSNNNTLIGNTASGGVHGFWLVDVTGNVLLNNQAQAIQLGDGPGTNTTGNTLIGNTTRGSPYSGFNFYGANGNTVSNNVAQRNGFCGFEAQSGSYNTFTDNTAVNNSQGFCVDAYAGPVGGGPAVGNTFTRDVSNHNRDNGFVLSEGTSGNLVTRSVARNNGICDAADDSVPISNTWTSNNFGTTCPAGLG